MKEMDNLPCDFNHPILNIIDSETRRHILRLLAAEPNYGNRLAAILRLSCPSIHRHLKLLQQYKVENSEVKVLGAKAKISESFSGHKGAQATLYEIISHTGIFFGIFPNFIHSQVVEQDKTGEILKREIDPDNYDPNLFAIQFNYGEELETDDTLDSHYTKIQQINKQIKEQQEYLMNLLYLKNQFIEKLNETLEKAKDLDFQERLVLKSLIIYGCNNIKFIANLLNTSKNDVTWIIKQLREKGWIVDKEILEVNFQKEK